MSPPQVLKIFHFGIIEKLAIGIKFLIHLIPVIVSRPVYIKVVSWAIAHLLQTGKMSKLSNWCAKGLISILIS